jgi:translation initiation factor 2D
MAVPTSEIKPRSGMKGKAVHIIHVYEDFLWSMGDKSEPPEMQDISDDGYEEEEEEEEDKPEAATNKDEAPAAATKETHLTDEKEEPNTKQLSTDGRLIKKQQQVILSCLLTEFYLFYDRD